MDPKCLGTAFAVVRLRLALRLSGCPPTMETNLRRTLAVPEWFVTGSHTRVLLLASKMRNLEVRDQRDTAPNGATYFGRRLFH